MGVTPGRIKAATVWSIHSTQHTQNPLHRQMRACDASFMRATFAGAQITIWGARGIGWPGPRSAGGSTCRAVAQQGTTACGPRAVFSTGGLAGHNDGRQRPGRCMVQPGPRPNNQAARFLAWTGLGSGCL